jgi:hypothetical protein
MSRLLQGVYKFLVQVIGATKFCTLAPNICGSWVCGLFHVTLLVPRVLIWFVDFWKIFWPLNCCIDVTNFVVLGRKGLPNCIYHESELNVVQGFDPGGDGIFCTHPDWPWGPPSLLYNGYWVPFLGVKQLGCGVGRPPTPSAEIKERVELYLYPLLCLPGRL